MKEPTYYPKHDFLKLIINLWFENFELSSNISVFTFSGIIRKQTSFTDKSNAIQIISGLTQENQNTAIYNAIDSANREFITNSRENSTKIMIVLTDGYDNYSTVSVNSVIQSAIDHNIVIYTVGVGTSNDSNHADGTIDTAILTNIAQSTGGIYYNTPDFSQLENIFNRLHVDVDLYKDSDEDGLSDYHEKKIATGEIKMGNNVPIKNCAVLNYLDADSDHDGIKDGYKYGQDDVGELAITFQEVKGKDVYYCYMRSNPCDPDSDGDGLNDINDPEPLIKHDDRFTTGSDITMDYRPISVEMNHLQVISNNNYFQTYPTLDDYDLYDTALINAAGGVFMFMPEASQIMQHFLSNTGDLYHISLSKLLIESDNAKSNLSKNLNALINACEQMTKDGKFIIISTTTAERKWDRDDIKNEQFKATDLSDHVLPAPFMKFIYERDWLFAIGNSTANMVCLVNRNGDSYSMTVNYYLDDFYNWENNPNKRGGLVKDSDMFRLHNVGLAKEFEVEGHYKGLEVSWNQGERFITTEDKPINSKEPIMSQIIWP